MLYISLIWSLVMVVGAYAAAREMRWGMHKFAVVLALAFVSGFLSLIAAAFHLVLLAVVLLFAGRYFVNFRRFATAAAGTGLVAYGVILWPTFGEVRKLRDAYPYESVETRLVRPPLRTAELAAPALDRLDNLENLIQEEDHYGKLRSYVLRRLHEETLDHFVNSPGFGFGRMIRTNRFYLTAGVRTPAVVPQPGTRRYLDPALAVPAVNPEEKLGTMHSHGVADFANPPGFGYVKDREHVAGFQAHQFSEVPNAETWKVESIDLVGLLMHEKPVVYVSEQLPRMDKLREVPVRPLDDFEQEGLETLKGGEDLFGRQQAGVMRLLGAVRGTRQCLSCHGGERGDLLGAFSYTLSQSEAKENGAGSR